MLRRTVILLLVAGLPAHASGDDALPDRAPTPCTAAWVAHVEERLSTGDGLGHGPDPGSEEWRSVVEFRLGIRDDPALPSRDSNAWCRHIDQRLREWQASSASDSDAAGASSEAGPSYDCDRVAAGGIEAMICQDPALSSLDRSLAAAYADARRKASNERPPRLKAEQRGWIKGRDECWKSDDRRECVREAYVHRIAALQARYRLVPFRGPVAYRCDNNPANEVIVTFFETQPPTLIAERGDSVSLMYRRPGTGDGRYQGRNESLREHPKGAWITWGFGAPAMDCQAATLAVPPVDSSSSVPAAP